MEHKNRLLAAALVMASLPLSACQQRPATATAAAKHEPPAAVERVAGTELSRVTLSEMAIQRIALKTDEVREAKVSRSTTKQKVVPYSALIYDARGNTWIYTSPQPRTFVRHKVQVNYIDRTVVVLKDGPPAGTVVVSVGAAELYGTEFKVGH
jgi:hypothetical protein